MVEKSEESPVGPGPALLERARSLLRDFPAFDVHAHPGRSFASGAKALSPAIARIAGGPPDEAAVVADMQAGGMRAAVFAGVADLEVLDLDGERLTTGRSFEPGEAWSSYLAQAGRLAGLAAQGIVTPILAADDLLALAAGGPPGACLAMEGGDFLEGDAGRVAIAHADGFRIIGLVHYRSNELGDAMTEPPVHDGLSTAGAQVVEAMNAAGMLIDLTHASEAMCRQVLENSRHPVMLSHSHVACGCTPFSRFNTPELARAVAGRGGLIGAWPAGIGISDIAGFADRVLELVNLVGVEHVALGTDMGANYRPVWASYRDTPVVVASLMERGLADRSVAAIIGGNMHRVLADSVG